MGATPIIQFQVDPRVASTGNSSLIQSSGIQNLNGKRLKNHATIRVDENIITWETSFDKCTFFRTLVGTTLPADATSPPCSKCANPWKGHNKISTITSNTTTKLSSTTPKEIVKDTTETTTESTTGTKSSISSLCTQSLNGTPYLVKKRPLIITKPSSRQVTQTSTCHQLITTARPVATSVTITEKTSRRVNGLVRASSTPNLKKVGVQHKSNVKKSKEQKGKWEYLIIPM